jgi:hypothetical protein
MDIYLSDISMSYSLGTLSVWVYTFHRGGQATYGVSMTEFVSSPQLPFEESIDLAFYATLLDWRPGFMDDYGNLVLARAEMGV